MKSTSNYCAVKCSLSQFIIIITVAFMHMLHVTAEVVLILTPLYVLGSLTGSNASYTVGSSSW